MNNITTFLANNYIWFLVIGIILIFALIGYIVDSKNIEQERPKTIKYQKDSKLKDTQPEVTLVKEESSKVDNNIQPTADKTEVLETVSLKQAIENNTNPDSIIKEEVKEESTFEK